MIIKRDAERTIKAIRAGYPVVTITGPRQSGKTTLARMLFDSLPYVSFENPNNYELALDDPQSLIEKYRGGAVFDEIQRAPKLFSSLQQVIDEGEKKTRFVLTGSQQFGLVSAITQSLAGRTALIQLLPFSLTEIDRYKGPKRSLDDVLFFGMYPPVHDRRLDPVIWYANYLNTYVERDVRQLLNIRDLSTFQRFIRLCAGRTGSLLNMSSLASDCGVTHSTAASWISILEAGYIIFLLRPYHANVSKRLVKTPKLYFVDPGFAAFLLSVQSPEHLNTHPMRGALFETLIVGELLKRRFNAGLPSNLFFYRDRTGNEVDVVIDEGTGLRPVEVKSGQTINDDFFKGLRAFSSVFPAKSARPAIIYSGKERHTRKGVSILPFQEADALL